MSELVGSIAFGLADVLTDAVVCARLLHGDVPIGRGRVPTEGYKAAYTATLCFGVVVALLTVAYRLHHARLVRAQLLQLTERGGAGSASEAQRQTQQHGWELTQTHRTQGILSLSLLSVAMQGAVPTPLYPPRTLAPCRVGCHCRCAHVHPQLLSDFHG